MSWTLFKTKCAVLSGPQHISKELFAQTIAEAYHQCISLHFDSMSGGGRLVNNAPKLPILNQQILGVCTANLASHQDVDFLKQIGPFIQAYWAGNLIVGPCGITTITSIGTWNNIKVPPNTDFNIILNALILSCRTHLMTLTGTFQSTVIVPPIPPLPWSGAMLQSLP